VSPRKRHIALQRRCVTVSPHDRTRHARLALAHGSDDTIALSISALVILHLGHDFDAASGAIARALSLNPSCAAAFYWGAHIHAVSGDLVLAEEYAHRALRLSPFDPTSFNTYLALGFVRARERRYDDAAGLSPRQCRSILGSVVSAPSR
jgi:adenylate cyclase